MAETGSFTKASRLLAISQPALSASISKLEDEFQLKLLDRGRDRVCPTQQGLALMEKANLILRICQSLKDDMQSAARTRALTIGVERTVSSRPIADFMRAFRTINAESETVLIDGRDDELRDRFSKNTLDATITARADGGRDTESVLLFEERLAAAIPSGHPLARFTSVRLADLEGEPVIKCLGCDMLRNMYDHFAKLAVVPNFVYTTDQSDRALSLVAAGVGIAILPEFQSAPGVTMVRLSGLPEVRTIVLTSRPAQAHPLLPELVALAAGRDWAASMTGGQAVAPLRLLASS